MDTQNNQTPKEAQTPENRRGMRIAIVIVVLIIIAAVIGNAKYRKMHDTTVVAPETSDCKPGDLFSQSTGKPCPKGTDLTADVSTATSTGPGGYEEAIRMYAGKVVIFDAECKALPGNPTFKAGTRILVANNSTKSLTLEVGDKKQALDAYHYYTYPLGGAGIVVASCNGTPAVNITVQ